MWRHFGCLMSSVEKDYHTQQTVSLHKLFLPSEPVPSSSARAMQDLTVPDTLSHALPYHESNSSTYCTSHDASKQQSNQTNLFKRVIKVNDPRYQLPGYFVIRYIPPYLL